jgi:hypothetical protein
MVNPRSGKGIGGSLGDASAAESIPIPPQPKLQPHLQPPLQVIATWSESARSLARTTSLQDIDTGVVDSLKALDPERPIRSERTSWIGRFVQERDIY